MAEESEALRSRASSRHSSTQGAAAAKPGAKPGLMEKDLLARGEASTSGHGSAIDQRSYVERSSIGGGRSSIGDARESVARRSVDGGGSLAHTVGSSAGTLLSDASRGAPPFVDPISKVQRLQRTRLHGRFSREARAQRRWEELKATAVTLTQQAMAK